MKTVRLKRTLTIEDGEHLMDYMPLTEGDILFVSDQDQTPTTLMVTSDPPSQMFFQVKREDVEEIDDLDF